MCDSGGKTGKRANRGRDRTEGRKKKKKKKKRERREREREKRQTIEHFAGILSYKLS